MNNPVISFVDQKSGKVFGTAGAPAKFYFSSDASSYQPIVSDSSSVPSQFYICNNVTLGDATAQDAYDIKQCKLGVRAIDGTFTEELVQGQWVKVKNVGIDTNYTQIGSLLDTDGVTWKEVASVVSCDSSNVGIIKGTANDGNITTGTAKSNSALIEAVAHVPLVCTPNIHQFRYR